jgi:CRP/FNR family transcriptional regulator, nitrogen oxide reductase regulator
MDQRPAIFGLGLPIQEKLISGFELGDPFMADMNQRMELLAGAKLFEGLDSSICAYMASSALSRHYACRDVIFDAGDPIRGVLLLTEGRVKLMRFSEEGAEVILRLCAPGEVVYPPAMVPEEIHYSTAETLQQCRLLAWDAKTFEAAEERFPTLRSNARCVVERQIRELERRYWEACTQKVSPRLALALHHLINQIGHPVKGRVEIALTRESLAQITAMNAATVSRVLSRWEKIGILSLRRECIDVCSVSGLSGLCKLK